MSNSVRPHRWQPTRFPQPWDSPGKNTGMGCHFFLQCMKVKVKVKSLSHVWLLATPWTAAHQAPPSMEFSRQEYQSGVPLPSPKKFPRAIKWTSHLGYTGMIVRTRTYSSTTAINIKRQCKIHLIFWRMKDVFKTLNWSKLLFRNKGEIYFFTT